MLRIAEIFYVQFDLFCALFLLLFSLLCNEYLCRHVPRRLARSQPGRAVMQGGRARVHGFNLRMKNSFGAAAAADRKAKAIAKTIPQTRLVESSDSFLSVLLRVVVCVVVCVVVVVV